jgi:hypothetical protein
MATLLSRAVREVFRRERIPVRLLWWFSAEAMTQWYSLLEDELAPHLGGREGARRLLARTAAKVLRRRYDALRAGFPGLPSPDDDAACVGLVMGGLYRVASAPESAWIFDETEGLPRRFAEHRRSERLLEGLPLRARWEEVTCHLGEVLVALTEDLPAAMDRARPVLGDICFGAGAHYGRRFKRMFGMTDSPEAALELLRMSEYVFRVNPEHWGGADAGASTGWLEGTACPWYTAPGWNGAHCGIFGQFQSGICSVFGLRYHLTTTIPKHGGHTCRIDVKPIPLRRDRGGAALGGRA